MFQVIKIRECDIYSYNPDSDGDPVQEKGAMYVQVNWATKMTVSLCSKIDTLILYDFLLVDGHSTTSSTIGSLSELW